MKPTIEPIVSYHRQGCNLDPTQDRDWERLALDFPIDPDTIYLNHGSFGIPSNHVRFRLSNLLHQLHQNPMEFYLQQYEPLLEEAKGRLADFLVTNPNNLVLVENATTAMSLIAAGFPLSSNDEVLITDHEYVPVKQMWQRRCAQADAKLVLVNLPTKIESSEQIVDSIWQRFTDRTRLLVISHITSPSALVLPIADICKKFVEAEVPVCVDGPHAPAQLDLNLDSLGCAFYAASCHKWLSAPLGSGFLYVADRWQDSIHPLVSGWGRLPPGECRTWSDQFIWQGTRDPCAQLAIPAAIEYLQYVGLEQFRKRTQYLAQYAETSLSDLLGTQPIARRCDGWYRSMTHLPLPNGDW